MKTDAVEKSLLSYDDVFADIANVLLFDGEKEVSGEALEQAVPRSIYKADGRLREQERDTAKYWKKEGIRIAFFGFENQGEMEDDMPLRIIGYDGANYRDQIYYVRDEAGKRRKNQNPRYPMVTLVLYFGTQKHWDKPLTLHESLKGMPEKLKKYVSDYKVNLFEIAWLSDEQVEKFQSDFRIVADYFVQKRKHKEYVPSAREIIHVREVLQMMSVFTQDHRFEEAYQEALREGKEVRNMCEVLDKIENRGVRKGVRKGRILEYIDIRREDGFSEQEILEGLQEKFHLTAEQAEKYAITNK